jgi:hypothetical protein
LVSDTISDLTEVADEYGVPVASSSGSITYDSIAQLGRRMARDHYSDGEERPTIVLYFGDFDPAWRSLTRSSTPRFRPADWGALLGARDTFLRQVADPRPWYEQRDQWWVD